MLCGSALAGITFGQTGLGNVHCMARFVGAEFHLSHGLSNAVCLPHVAKFNLLAVPEKFARVAEVMGCPVQGLPTLQAAQAAVDAITALCADLSIPASTLMTWQKRVLRQTTTAGIHAIQRLPTSDRYLIRPTDSKLPSGAGFP